MLQKLPLKPGVYKDDSPLEAEGYWIDADKVRFVRGLPETIYGWEKASASTLLGVCRGATTWADNAGNPYAAFGTTQRLYAMTVDGIVADITPVVSRGTLGNNPFTSTISLTTMTIAHTAHGLSALQLVTFSNASTVNGINPDGAFPVLSVTDANDYVVDFGQAATGNGAGGGSSVYYAYSLAPGQVDGLGGFGYGTGGFGSGGYSGSGTGLTLWPTTWCLNAWGQNLIANPRGGALYEWAPNLTASELTINGTFTGGATAWTLGSGWSYGSNNVIAASCSTALSQVVSLPVGAWCLLESMVSTYTSGALQASVAGVNAGVSIGAAGESFITFFSGSGGNVTLSFTGASANLTFDNVSLQVLTVGNVITNAPTVVTCSFVTSERILVACGCNDDLNGVKFAGAFDAMRIAWSDQEANQTWTPTTSNLAGSWTLTGGSRIVRGLPGFGVNAILTDTSFHTMTYVPDPTVIYSFLEVAKGCGLIGPNAVTQVLGRIFWMTPQGDFYVYDGTFPRSLNCTLRRDLFDNLAWVQQDKIYAFPCAARSEIWWLYPDSRDGVECSRYVIYNFVENHWSCGTFTRTAWVDAGIFEYPLAVDVNGSIYYHEKGASGDGGARSWFAETAYIDIGDGDKHLAVMGMKPDAGSLQGNYTVQLDARIRNNQGILSRTFGPYGVTAATGNVSFKANGQEMKYTWAGNSAPAFWRMGATRFDITQTGRVK